MVPITSLVLFCLVLLAPTSSVFQQIPGLYLDRFTLWKTSGVSNPYVAGGYNFLIIWRQTLPGVQSTALGLYNFKTGKGKILDFNAEITSATTSSAIINVLPIGGNGGIVYVAYSIVVITQNNSYLEILTTTQTNLVDYKKYTVYFDVNSTKFTFGTATFQVNQFVQWIRTNGNSCDQDYWYWISLEMNTVSSTPIVRIPYFQDNDIHSVKLNILIVAQQIGTQSATFFETFSQSGLMDNTLRGYDYYKFQFNFGLSTAIYGESTSGYNCLLGITSMDLNCPLETCNSNSFFFGMTGTDVSSIGYEDIESVRVYTVCYALGNDCSVGTFYNQTSLNCDPCVASCSSCDSTGNCYPCSFNSTVFNQCSNLDMDLSYFNTLYNSTQVDQCYTPPSMAWIAAIVVPGFVIIVIIICVCCYCCKKREDRQVSHACKSQSMVQTREVLTIENWKIPDYNEIDEESICSICLYRWNGFQSACGHYFHIPCIVEWSKRKSECTLCRQSLNVKQHKVFCESCGLVYKSITLKQLSRLYEQGQLSKGIQCDDCLNA